MTILQSAPPRNRLKLNELRAGNRGVPLSTLPTRFGSAGTKVPDTEGCPFHLVHSDLPAPACGEPRCQKEREIVARERYGIGHSSRQTFCRRHPASPRWSS